MWRALGLVLIALIFLLALPGFISDRGLTMRAYNLELSSILFGLFLLLYGLFEARDAGRGNLRPQNTLPAGRDYELLGEPVECLDKSYLVVNLEPEVYYAGFVKGRHDRVIACSFKKRPAPFFSVERGGEEDTILRPASQAS